LRAAVVGACSLLAACATTPLLVEQRVIDLTHDFDATTIYLPNEQAFHYERVFWGRDDLGRWRATGQFSTSEHGGTHVEAPIAHAEGLRATSEIPLAQLIGPIRVIDIVALCAKDRDYVATPDDLERHERTNGRIPAGAAVIVRTGWDRHWNNPRRYLGRSEDARAEDLHFPGLSVELAHALVQRRVDLVAIDGPGLDPGMSKDAAASRELAHANIPGLENLNDVGKLPQHGATLIALPMKIAGGSGGPTRVVALLP
jgi:kynurenine formamidase